MIRLPSSVRSLWPHLLLVVTFGAAGWVALHAHRTSRAHRAAVHEALQDYGTFASWSYEQHARQEVEHAFWQFLNPVNHGEALHVSESVPSAADLVHYLPFDSAGCFCHRPDYVPDAVFALRVGSDSLDVAPNFHPGPSRGIRVVPSGHPDVPDGVVDRPDPRRYAAAERRRLVEALTGDARGRYRIPWRMAVLATPGASGTSLIGYTLMPTARGDTLLYGLELPGEETARLFGRVLDERELLPESFVRSRANREIVHATVLSPGGDRLFSSGPVPETELVGRGTLSDRLGALTIRTAISPDVAGDLLIGGPPGSRLPLVLGILAVAAALAVVSVGQIRKEGELARQRTEFVSAVSHELRTPLAQIRLFLETLRMGRFGTEEQREDALERIDRETGRLAHLVESILHFARSEHGSTSDDAGLLSLGAEVRDAADSFALLADARDARIEVDVDPELVVRADRRELRQILVNLLDNAVKYGPRNQTVTIRGRLEGGDARIEVEDEGSGVPTRDRERIWEAFQRGSGGGGGSPGGSGIGLAVVREIARRHGGDAHVEDAPGGGARFVVTLPGERLAGATEAGTADAPSPDLIPATRSSP